MATTANKIIGKVKGIPAHIVAMQRAADIKHTKKPINTIGELVKVKIPGAGSKRSKKIPKNSNNTGIAMHGPGHKKPVPSPLADALFANDDDAPIGGPPSANDNNIVMVHKKPENGRNANNIMSHSMNDSVGLDKNWTVLFAHDVVIPVGNPMAPILALSHDISKPVAFGGASATLTGPVARQGTDIYNNPLDKAPLNIQELVRRKAEELMRTNNIKLEDLFMDRP